MWKKNQHNVEKPINGGIKMKTRFKTTYLGQVIDECEVPNGTS